VQRCTKTGKLFKDTDGYSTLFVEKLLAARILAARTLSVPRYGGMDYSKTYSIERAPGAQPFQKVNNEKAIQVTRLKNRINYLEGRIANDAKRLAVAKQELANLS
jgi:TolA-binding protein